MTVRSITIACILSCVGCDGWYQVRGRLKTPAGDSIPAANIEVYQGTSCNVAAALRSRGTSLPDGTYSIGFVDSPFGDQVMAVHFQKQGFAERCTVVPVACVLCESGPQKCCVVDEQLTPATTAGAVDGGSWRPN